MARPLQRAELVEDNFIILLLDNRGEWTLRRGKLKGAYLSFLCAVARTCLTDIILIYSILIQFTLIFHIEI